MSFGMTIEWTGVETHRRYVINRGDDTFWTGKGWSPALTDALKYAKHQEACHDLGKMAEEYFRGLPTREFEVTLKVKVFSADRYDLQELKEYLSAAATFVIVPDVLGYGPVPDSMTQVQIPWEGLKEVRPISQAPKEGDQWQKRLA